MELLLFLSAMLAGLTGLISGDRAVETRQVERTSVAASAAVEAAAGIAEAAAMAAAPYPSSPGPMTAASDPEPLAAAAATRQTPPVDERRLE